MFGNNLLLRRGAAQEIGGYDERLRTNGEDADLSRRLRASGWLTVYEPSALVGHLRRDTLRSLANTLWRYRVAGSKLFVDSPPPFRRVLRSLRGHTRDTIRRLKLDLKSGRFPFVPVDLFILAYAPWRDLVHLARMTRDAAREDR